MNQDELGGRGRVGEKGHRPVENGNRSDRAMNICGGYWNYTGGNWHHKVINQGSNRGEPGATGPEMALSTHLEYLMVLWMHGFIG